MIIQVKFENDVFAACDDRFALASDDLVHDGEVRHL
ncbi:hypothetical protein SDC9_206843 [bioreactor metagenome]|uniref:Uncharacterized protein n=1 Tax=bioreactor metagenome TaxID=1076179 RepID=A0A645J5X0_9ZZZZ